MYEQRPRRRLARRREDLLPELPSRACRASGHTGPEAEVIRKQAAKNSTSGIPLKAMENDA